MKSLRTIVGRKRNRRRMSGDRRGGRCQAVIPHWFSGDEDAFCNITPRNVSAFVIKTESTTQWQADLAPKEMAASDMRNRRHEPLQVHVVQAMIIMVARSRRLLLLSNVVVVLISMVKPIPEVFSNSAFYLSQAQMKKEEGSSNKLTKKPGLSWPG
ncbi:hypothetical protein LAZ67_8000283 [Cordylochernes scorpioides]|uniref:Uncharacterized protein n=1 Tax=Cordylochernes scorpioides TaxID=51811 RepID=A0ABY6KP89_9ARAC|nr:hypothetical protein LAZ67_8000283 [Cordylochernes scorpioides]